MNKIEKVSEIQVKDVADYLRLTETDDAENAYLDNLITISKDFIKIYTGLTDEKMDKHSDLVIVVFILCQDMYDNRSLNVDKTNINKIVDTVLGMHSVNLLPRTDENV